MQDCKGVPYSCMVTMVILSIRKRDEIVQRDSKRTGNHNDWTVCCCYGVKMQRMIHISVL